MQRLKKMIPGMALCLIIAIPSWFLGKLFPIVGSAVFGILFGMILNTVYPKITALWGVNEGIRYTSKKLLQYAIILLGFEMNMYHVIRVGGQSLLVMLFTLSTAFLIAFFAGRFLKISGNTKTLVGVGTSICGGSAIAATAPVIGADDGEVAKSVSTIFLFNIIAVFIFPYIGRILNMSDIGFGMWAGTAVNDTSSVVAAASSWSNMAGNNVALSFAAIVKLTRTLMIVPVTLFLAIYTSMKKKTDENHFRFTKVFPWFVLGFAATAVINTFAGLPVALSGFLVNAGKFVIVMAMAAIGLNTNIKKLVFSEWRPIVLGLCCWIGVAVVSVAVQYVIGLL